ncbi:quinonoid dihydropteridine reductase, putative [Bodo saltans]|uniref:Dihydropteridine reductase n=1 Tax=Bodo saltans TaxID=75058 RepID=A0A0S4IVE4_BODSA|nr:quinonoid dihydropteridine reductase, putative [Bodo saltans]|eukprot:CUF10597.1 quinonoid dihydropteridine reductase, putative [Bodo saltans]
MFCEVLVVVTVQEQPHIYHIMSRTALVLGANGALGKDVIRAFASKKWQIFGADVSAPSSDIHKFLLSSTVLKPEWSIEELQNALLKETAQNKFDAVVNVAGGWAGGSVADASTAAATELMLRQSVWTSVAAAHIASVRGNENVFCALTGSAAAAAGGTAGMVGYGLAKAAVHHLVSSVAADPSKMPKGSTVIGVLPVTLDTPGNRAGMPDADFSAWTPTMTVAELLVKWSEGISRPENGTLASWETKAGKSDTVSISFTRADAKRLF